MASKKPVIHGRDHTPGGADPIPGFDTPVWEDITGNLVVTRVIGTDTDPDIGDISTKAFLFSTSLTGLKVVKLLIRLGAGGAGSGTSQYLVQGLGVRSLDNMYAGRGYIRKTSASSQPIFGCQLIGTALSDTLEILYDGSTTGIAMGPKASSGGGPFDFAAGDTIFNGTAIFQ